jgi:hypothetical protein
MVQTMKFIQNSDAVEVSEAFSNGTVRVYVFTGGSGGSIDFDETRLIEMRNWINRQLLKIKKQKSRKK